MSGKRKKDTAQDLRAKALPSLAIQDTRAKAEPSPAGRLAIECQRTVPGLGTLYLADLAPGLRPGARAPRLVEFVDTLEPGVPNTEKWVMMISTQLGCPVGCRMCDTGLLDYRGNLTAGEMLAQVRHVIARNPDLDVRTHPKVKIHFARMGEPSLNPAVLDALELLRCEYPFPGILPSISTIAPRSPAARAWFDRLLEIKDRLYPDGLFQLQFSLHAADPAKRRAIVPIPTWDLPEVAAYARRFVRPRDRKLTLNFALGPGESLDASAIAEHFDPAFSLVKVTPVNPTRAAEAAGLAHVWMRAPRHIAEPAAELERRGFEVILSPSAVEEIDGETSCGQLWSGALKDTAETALRNRRRELEAYVTSESLPSMAAGWKAEASRTAKHALSLEPERAALLVVDMQEFFLSRRSAAYMPQAKAVLPNIRALVGAFRLAGRPVYFTLHAHKDLARDGGLMAFWWGKTCVTGTPEARVSHVLEPRGREVLRKCRYSAFTNPVLARRLKESGIRQLVVAGIMTNLCVESTVRDAFDRGFLTFVPADATAAHAEELHVGSLKSLSHGFSSVVLTDEVLARLKSPDPTAGGRTR